MGRPLFRAQYGALLCLLGCWPRMRPCQNLAKLSLAQGKRRACLEGAPDLLELGTDEIARAFRQRAIEAPRCRAVAARQLADTARLRGDAQLRKVQPGQFSQGLVAAAHRLLAPPRHATFGHAQSKGILQ